ncbi:hypothetical protein HAX54_022607 [Datura stramonium]|uniref:BCAS3 domain-containing protein n=1 Tax=Datura stramonium TaxID=4076 RepID=A0ABS8S458_DATST|nr:hypothetical protein [Datura stramonium]
MLILPIGVVFLLKVSGMQFSPVLSAGVSGEDVSDIHASSDRQITSALDGAVAVDAGGGGVGKSQNSSSNSNSSNKNKVKNGTNSNGFIPNSSSSSHLASNGVVNVRSAGASVAGSSSDDHRKDQVLWACFDRLELMQPIPAKSDGREGYKKSHPLLLVVACDDTKDSAPAKTGRDGFVELREGSIIHSPTLSTVLVSAWNKFVMLHHPVPQLGGQGVTGVNIGYGPMAVGPRWLAYASNNPLLSNTGRLSPQSLSPSPGVSPSTSPGNGNLTMVVYIIFPGQSAVFLAPTPAPITLSVVNRIKNVNSGWLNTVSNAASSAAGKGDIGVKVDPIQWWDVCRRADWPEREECIHGITLGGREAPDMVMGESLSEDDDTGEKDSAKLCDRSHWYLSNAEVQLKSGRIPIWQKSKIYFCTMILSGCEEQDISRSLLQGRLRIEKIPVNEDLRSKWSDDSSSTGKEKSADTTGTSREDSFSEKSFPSGSSQVPGLHEVGLGPISFWAIFSRRLLWASTNNELNEFTELVADMDSSGSPCNKRAEMMMGKVMICWEVCLTSLKKLPLVICRLMPDSDSRVVPAYLISVTFSNAGSRNWPIQWNIAYMPWNRAEHFEKKSTD